MTCAYRSECVDDERVLIKTNSLSFYKEEIAGETSNYVHLRAETEQTSPLEVLRRLTEEVLDSAERIEKIVSEDRELSALWHQYLQVRFVRLPYSVN